MLALAAIIVFVLWSYSFVHDAWFAPVLASNYNLPISLLNRISPNRSSYEGALPELPKKRLPKATTPLKTELIRLRMRDWLSSIYGSLWPDEEETDLRRSYHRDHRLREMGRDHRNHREGGRDHRNHREGGPREIRDELIAPSNLPELKDTAKKSRDALLPSQRNVYNAIIAAIHAIEQGIETEHCFFVDAPGGTGKTFTFNAVCNDDNHIYRKYRRRSPADGGATYMHEGRLFNNQWVVPYSPYLLLKYNCHINVEACISVRGVKYLYKYVFKGPDRSMVALHTNSADELDEVGYYQDMRSMGNLTAQSNATAVVHRYGRPLLFITFTHNDVVTG